ncbi:Non-specific lipid transfer protein GPI-anchored 2 [Spatholobus suberectus]|nr:Non-specific lipid transfer protein GPI-anchored 2 [Spatholobus suberectus]
MAKTTITTTIAATRVVAIATLVLALACCATSAPTPAPEAAAAPAPGSSGCLMALTNMSDCLTYVEDGSKLTKPGKGCCPELAGLIDSNPICLCEMLAKPDSIGIKIDLNKALKLPSVCGVTTPPVSTCAAVGFPVSLPPSISEGSISPSMAPGATSPSNSDAASSPGGISPSQEAAASPSENKNGASSFQTFALTYFIFGMTTLLVSVFF